MDIVVKVIIDEKEYNRLLEIERRYKELSSSNQSGHGNVCHCAPTDGTDGSDGSSKTLPLSEIVARNAEKHAVDTPIPGILPSITDPTTEAQNTRPIGGKGQEKTKDDGTGSEIERTIDTLGVAKFVHPWYYIGAPHPL